MDLARLDGLEYRGVWIAPLRIEPVAAVALEVELVIQLVPVAATDLGTPGTDDAGNSYVAYRQLQLGEGWTSHITSVDPDGAVRWTTEISAEGIGSAPAFGLAVDAAGHVFVVG